MVKKNYLDSDFEEVLIGVLEYAAITVKCSSPRIRLLETANKAK